MPKQFLTRSVIAVLMSGGVCQAMIACGSDTSESPGAGPGTTNKPDAKVTPEPEDAGEDAIVAPPGSHCEDDTCSGQSVARSNGFWGEDSVDAAAGWRGY